MAVVLVFCLLLLACGAKTPMTPSTPPPPQFPSMIGGWGGTSAETFAAAGFQPIARTCEVVMIVTGQSAGDFTGNFQRTPGTDASCSLAGLVDGSVAVSGAVGMHARIASAGECVLLTNSATLTYNGNVSPAGGLTVIRNFIERCPYSRGGTLDYMVSETVSLNRR